MMLLLVVVDHGEVITVDIGIVVVVTVVVVIITRAIRAIRAMRAMIEIGGRK